MENLVDILASANECDYRFISKKVSQELETVLDLNELGEGEVEEWGGGVGRGGLKSLQSASHLLVTKQ